MSTNKHPTKKEYKICGFCLSKVDINEWFDYHDHKYFCDISCTESYIEFGLDLDENISLQVSQVKE